MTFGPNEAAIDEIVASCNGDLRGALKALLLVNEHLEAEIAQLYAAAAQYGITERGNNALTYLRGLRPPPELEPVVSWLTRSLTFSLWLEETKLEFFRSGDVNVLRRRYEDVEPARDCGGIINDIARAGSPDAQFDLVVLRYIQWDWNDVWCGEHREGYRGYCHPDVFQPISMLAYHNNGNGTFTEEAHQGNIC